MYELRKDNGQRLTPVWTSYWCEDGGVVARCNTDSLITDWRIPILPIFINSLHHFPFTYSRPKKWKVAFGRLNVEGSGRSTSREFNAWIFRIFSIFLQTNIFVRWLLVWQQCNSCGFLLSLCFLVYATLFKALCFRTLSICRCVLTHSVFMIWDQVNVVK